MFNMQNRGNQINALFMSEQVNFLFLAKVLKKITIHHMAKKKILL